MGRSNDTTVATHRWVAAITALSIGAIVPLITLAQPPKHYRLADLKALQSAFVELADDVRPSVVAIRTYQMSRPEGSRQKSILLPYSQGSGFVIGDDGYIATNAHVIMDADSISVVANSGLKYDATVVQVDRRSDLAVLKVNVASLPPVKFGDLANVKVNQWAFACGNPFGLANDDGRTSVTYGVVSALGRQMTRRLARNSNIEYYGNLIETSATINPGNSGGPLFNLDGDVIGVVTAIETSSGVNEGHGYAIPVDRNMRRILDTLKTGESVRYGFLGITVQDVEAPGSTLVADSRAYYGTEVHSLSFAGSPAEKAGLRPRDILIEYDGKPIENADHFVRLVGFTPVGAEVPVTYLRDGVKRKTVVAVGDRYELLTRVDRDE